LIIFFFLTAPSTTQIFTLSLHDALPIYRSSRQDQRLRSKRIRKRRLMANVAAYAPGYVDQPCRGHGWHVRPRAPRAPRGGQRGRSEEHTSELQSRSDLVCRLLLEKKKKK